MADGEPKFTECPALELGGSNSVPHAHWMEKQRVITWMSM